MVHTILFTTACVGQRVYTNTHSVFYFFLYFFFRVLPEAPCVRVNTPLVVAVTNVG